MKFAFVISIRKLKKRHRSNKDCISNINEKFSYQNCSPHEMWYDSSKANAIINIINTRIDK